MNRILEFGKGLLGLFLFYFLQIGFHLLFYNILIKDNFLINNMLYIIKELIIVIVLSIMNYKKLKNEIPDLSLATVYRNLNEFIADGDAISVGFVNSQERFDGNTKPHTHFVCEKCSRVLDLDCFNEDSVLDSSAQEEFGGTVRYHSLVFYGLCPECVNNAERLI